MPQTVALAVTDGIPVFEAAVPTEIFGVKRSCLADPWYDFVVCGSAGARIGGRLRFESMSGLEELVTADTVLVPAWQEIESAPPADLVEAVRAAYEAGARIVSICTGAFVLAAAGVLDRRRATTHWMYCDLLAERYPEVKVDPDVLYIDEGQVLTSAGKSAGIDLCLHIVRLDYGAAVANELARRLVMPPHRDGGQAQFIAPSTSGERVDHLLAELLPWVIERLDKPLTVVDLARRARMSTRTLNRHFNAMVGKTPLQWLLAQRIQQAQELLETTTHSVEQIAEQTGMGTAATLRRHFNRVVGVSPNTYRRTFRTDGPREADGSVPLSAAVFGRAPRAAALPARL
jgi:AraC family transcriptional regulator, transcriptional activator FtrA